VDEKRTFLRAFVREIEFDPRSRSGTGYFYAVPVLGEEGGPGLGGGTRSQPATMDSGAEVSKAAQDAKSSLRLRNVGTRYAPKRTAPEGGGSSLTMVAGAGFGADSERVPLLTAHWVYRGERQTVRQMRRVGLAA
ncbi:MAG TPA: hypothetical protein VM537_19490, partial [Anaerolineae bacterium]|nr:hypothetical protein [Anaerolineae bacterium]